MRKSFKSWHEKSFYAFFVLLFISFMPAQAQDYYYAQWAGNLAVGDNIFDITTGTTHTNRTADIYAVTTELLANSVTVNAANDNVSVQVKKVSRSQFKITTTTAINNVFVTAQYPGMVVICNAPTLLSVTRSGTNATFSWTNNGSPTSAAAVQWSSDGVNWTGGAGSAISPVTMPNVPTTLPMYYRVVLYAASPCPQVSSNVVTATSCTAPTLVSAVRDSTTPTTITFTWNNNGSTLDNTVMEYSQDGGSTWTQTCNGNTTSPRTCTGLPSGAIQVRIRATGAACNVVSNAISLALGRYAINSEAVGKNYTSPITSCGNVCISLYVADFPCGLDSNTNVGVGTQVYVKNTANNLWYPANSNNVAAYSTGTCTGGGLKWIRFVNAGNTTMIYNVNPDTGIILSEYGSCN